MKNLLLLVSLVVLSSCNKDEMNVIPIGIAIDVEDEEYDEVHALISSPMGTDSYVKGTLHELHASDAPGWRFLGWRKMSLYCEYQPVVDSDDFRTMYIYADEDYMGNCNNGIRRVWVVAEYIKIF